MKTIFFLALSALFSLPIIAQQHYQINGNFYLNIDNNKVYLKIWKDVDWIASLDSFIIKNNQFQFQGEMPYISARAQIYFKSASKFEFFDFIVDEGNNKISFQQPESSSGSIFSKSAKPISVSNQIDSKIDTIYDYYLSKYGTYTEDLTNGGQILVLNNSEKNGEQNKDIFNLISRYPNSFYSLIRLYALLYSFPFRDDPSDLMKSFYLLSPDIQSSTLGRKFYDDCSFVISSNNASKIGQDVPKFEVGTFEGKTFRTDDLRGQNYIIAFSATWCIPCQYYKKQLIKLYNEYKENKFKVVYFNLDDDVGRWQKEIGEIGLDWIFVSEKVKFEDSEIAKSFNVFSIPSYFLIGKDGIIKYSSNELKDMNFTQLETFIKNEVKN